MNIEAAATANQNGLELFAAADPDKATDFLKKAYRHWADEKGILVNLGLALMQQGYRIKQHIATNSQFHQLSCVPGAVPEKT